MFRQWARGVEIATGDLVWIAEADDDAEPRFLSALVPCFDDADTVMAYTESRQIGPEGEVLSNDYLEYVKDIDPKRWRHSWRRNGLDEIGDTLSIKNTIPNVSAVLFKRDRLAQALRSDMEWISSYKTAGDWATYVSILQQGGDIAFVAEALNDHRRHESGVAIGAFGPAIVSEIRQMQHDVRNRVDVPEQARRASASYLELLEDQFSAGSSSTSHTV